MAITDAPRRASDHGMTSHVRASLGRPLSRPSGAVALGSRYCASHPIAEDLHGCLCLFGRHIGPAPRHKLCMNGSSFPEIARLATSSAARTRRRLPVSPRKPGGSTPTMVCGTPFSPTVRPMTIRDHLRSVTSRPSLERASGDGSPSRGLYVRPSTARRRNLEVASTRPARR